LSFPHERKQKTVDAEGYSKGCCDTAAAIETAIPNEKRGYYGKNDDSRQVRALGFEPRTYALKVRNDNQLKSCQNSTYENGTNNLSENLSSLLEAYSELEVVVKAWPNLPANVKKAILMLLGASDG
jgi:hypothetical protein